MRKDRGSRLQGAGRLKKGAVPLAVMFVLALAMSAPASAASTR